jgi:hypothetical protein
MVETSVAETLVEETLVETFKQVVFCLDSQFSSEMGVYSFHFSSA